MKNGRKVSLIALAMTCVLLGTQAWAVGPQRRRRRRRPAPDPAAMATRCAERMTASADRCARITDCVANSGARTITRLLAAGRVDVAERVADQRIECVNRIARVYATMIQRTCDQCVRMLTNMATMPEADTALIRRLIGRLNAVCAAQIANVRQAQQDAVDIIETALAGE